MKRSSITLTESQLHKMIGKTVSKVINEMYEGNDAVSYDKDRAMTIDMAALDSESPVDIEADFVEEPVEGEATEIDVPWDLDGMKVEGVKKDASVMRLTESQFRSMIDETVRTMVEEGFFKNLGRGIAGVGRGIANGIGNAVDNARMNAYQSQMQGMNADNQKIDAQIQQLEASKQGEMQRAAEEKEDEIDAQIEQLQAQKGNVDKLQGKWNAAAGRINNRQQSGYINQRQYPPQNAAQPQQGNMNYNG